MDFWPPPKMTQVRDTGIAAPLLLKHKNNKFSFYVMLLIEITTIIFEVLVPLLGAVQISRDLKRGGHGKDNV